MLPASLEHGSCSPWPPLLCSSEPAPLSEWFPSANWLYAGTSFPSEDLAPECGPSCTVAQAPNFLESL